MLIAHISLICKSFDEIRVISVYERALSIYTEQVDDIPLLLQQMQHPDLAGFIIFTCIPMETTYGGLACVWLTYILSQADHRMSRVCGWAEQRLFTLQNLLPPLHGGD